MLNDAASNARASLGWTTVSSLRRYIMDASHSLRSLGPPQRPLAADA